MACDLLRIDGSRGEGGGQMVRSAVTLSCMTRRPVRIRNIRAGRRVAGLRPQHVAAVRILQKISGAAVTGCWVGSTELEFLPGDVRGQTLYEDVGTAGSITLILQAIIPLAAVLKDGLEVRIRGGTDVSWSPTADYTQRVLGEAFGRMGIRFDMEVVRRGYFPRGGGEITLRVHPAKGVRAATFSGGGRMDRAKILCSFSKVPVRDIQNAVGLIEARLERGSVVTETEIRDEGDRARDPGASVLAYSVRDGSVFGADSLFDGKGGNGFGIGTEGFTDGRFAVDRNLADMLVVPASLAAGKTVFEVGEITSHLETNLFVASEVTGCRYGAGRLSDGYRIVIEGTGGASSDPGIKQGRKEQNRNR